MSTIIRSEVSKKNIYWIERHRYYELKHFCLQYPLWKKAYSEIDGLCRQHSDTIKTTSPETSPTEKLAEDMIYYSERMDMVERAAYEADATHWQIILSRRLQKGIPMNISSYTRYVMTVEASDIRKN